MHPEIHQVIDSATPEAALTFARSAGASSDVWNDKAWRTVAAFASSAAAANPAWMALCIFAHERRSAAVAAIDALTKRACFIATSGAAEHDPFRNPHTFFAGVRRFIGVESSQAALETFQGAMNVVFSADRKSPEWSRARDQFIRSRRLRDIGKALRSVAERGEVIPDDLVEWLTWATLREVNGKVVA